LPTIALAVVRLSARHLVVLITLITSGILTLFSEARLELLQQLKLELLTAAGGAN
jgi:hypothetical protein